MSTRYSTPLLGLCLAIAAAGLLSPTAAQQWVMPRMPNGHPDLQGNWSNATLTPLQRGRNLGPVYTAEDVDRLEGRAENRLVVDAQPSDPDRPPPEAGITIVGYNQVFYNRGDRVLVINGEARSSLITNPANGRRPPLLPEAQELRQERRAFRGQFGQSDHPELRTLTDRCLMFGPNVGPPMLPNGRYNNNYTIVQTPDYVMINAEVIHDTRIIQLGEPDRLPDHIRPWMGDSWGRWEGDMLVVETTNFHPMQEFNGIPAAADLKVIERFTRIDEETIRYEFTIDDPETYTQQWGGELNFAKFHDYLYEFACHEGNYSMAAMLTGARFEESQAEQNRR